MGSISSGAAGRVFPAATAYLDHNPNEYVLAFCYGYRGVDVFRGGRTCFPGRDEVRGGESQGQGQPLRRHREPQWSATGRPLFGRQEVALLGRRNRFIERSHVRLVLFPFLVFWSSVWCLCPQPCAGPSLVHLLLFVCASPSARPVSVLPFRRGFVMRS